MTRAQQRQRFILPHHLEYKKVNVVIILSSYIQGTKDSKMLGGGVNTTSHAENNQRAIEFRHWFPIYRKRSIKSRQVAVPSSFISYLCDEDSILLPDGVAAPATSVDQLSDDEDVREVECEPDEAVATALRFGDLNTQLKVAIEELGGSVFVKFNCVAPVDAKWINGGTLKCLNLEQIYLLLKSSSKVTEFIEETIAVAQREEPGNEMSYYIVLRKWSNLHPAMEFRCFVKSNVLVGACQRDCSCHFDFLLRDKDDIKETIVEFMDSLLSSESEFGQCPYVSFICDLYVDKAGKCWIIDFGELNEEADLLLYTWGELCGPDNVDRNSDLFELRIVETSDQIISHSIANSGPLEAVDIAAGAVAGFGDWRGAWRQEQQHGEDD